MTNLPAKRGRWSRQACRYCPTDGALSIHSRSLKDHSLLVRLKHLINVTERSPRSDADNQFVWPVINHALVMLKTETL